jgi:hypothetical protein
MTGIYGLRHRLKLAHPALFILGKFVATFRSGVELLRALVYQVNREHKPLISVSSITSKSSFLTAHDMREMSQADSAWPCVACGSDEIHLADFVASNQILSDKPAAKFQNSRTLLYESLRLL